jgi:DNA-binding response OmpR family regulator
MASPVPRARVLLVEDDVNAARMLAQLLREDGYEVEVVHDGLRALERLAVAPAPDALLVDYRLPGVDGLAVARAARAHTPRARVFMVTSYPEVVATKLRAEDAGAVLVTKPLSYDELTRHLAAG